MKVLDLLATLRASILEHRHVPRFALEAGLRVRIAPDVVEVHDGEATLADAYLDGPRILRPDETAAKWLQQLDWEELTQQAEPYRDEKWDVET